MMLLQYQMKYLDIITNNRTKELQCMGIYVKYDFYVYRNGVLNTEK